MRSHFVPFIIGSLISLLVTYFSYLYIERQNRSDYLNTDSRFFESLQILQSRIDDLKMTSRPGQKTDVPVALIAIDDPSIEEIGRWPWSRVTLAQISDEVLANGAKSITYDILLSEPERENPEADKILGGVVQKYADQFVLGTATSSGAPAQTLPFQDICTAEAFLYLGGDKIVTLNPTFVLDDQSPSFEDYKWNELFAGFFSVVTKAVEKQFLFNLNKTEVTQLSSYQKNSLHSKTNKAIYNYCYRWLTDEDEFLQNASYNQTLAHYEQAVGKKFDQNSFNAFVREIRGIKSHPVPQYVDWYANVPEIQDSSKYTASFITRMDSDGIVRRYPLFSRVGAKVGSSYIPSLALQSYLIAKNYRAEVSIAEDPQRNQKILTSFKIFDSQFDKEPLYNVPVDSFSQLRLNYYGPQKSFYYLSAKELLTKDQKNVEVQIWDGKTVQTQTFDKKDFFKDRSFLVGATALGTNDLRNTPIQNAMPGPEIHLTALANLLERNFLLDIPNPQISIPVMTLALGLFFTLIWIWGSALISIAIFMVSSVILTALDYYFFSKRNYMITDWSLFAVFILSFISISLYKYFAEERNKSKVRKAFSKYVSPAVVEELLKNEKNLELGGSKKHLTILFSDLRGFTTFSEKLDPKQLGDFLNLYLTRMTEEIYRTSGTVDKFIGDAIMAFYGAPVPNEQHAQMACRCALQSVKKLEQLNIELKGKNFPHLEMGMGINTGDVSVGNMGSSMIQNYTVMGDAVNLASRLEGLTRLYGNFIILGPLTYEAVKNEFTCREIDQVVVKGKTQALRIYDLLYEGPPKAEDQEWLVAYRGARDKYVEGKFEEAKNLFEHCERLNPQDKISTTFVKKCKDLIANPPTEAWTGVNHLREK